MPTYNYVCNHCGHKFEKFSSITSYHKELECPICHEMAHLTISGGAGMIFKGSGFYITDYKKNHASVNEDKKSK